MSTDWKRKLAWTLRDLPDTNLDLLRLAGHRFDLLGDISVEVDVGARGEWLSSSADRVPFPTGRAADKVQVDWGIYPEVTHPTAKQRHKADAIDLDATRKVVDGLIDEAARRFDRDARKMSLWIWRYLAERLAAAEGGPGTIAAEIPADPRVPNLSVWQRFAFDSALVAACPSPSFLVVQVLPAASSLEEAATLQDLWAISRIDADLVWQAMLPIIEELGPEAILSPSMRHVEQVDGWLAEQGVTPAVGVEPMPPCGRVAGSSPGVFVALVPSDRARELGEACKKRFEEAWNQLAGKARDALVKDGWVSAGDEAWTSTWARQVSRACEVSWTAVGWGEDSTGAGSLLPKLDVTAHEKWARVQEDAAGLDDPWPGIYFGLWYSSALGASAARRNMGGMSVLCEPGRPCTACGQRAALHSDIDVAAFWNPISGREGKSGGAVRHGESLCSICALRRMSKSLDLVAVPEDYDACANSQFALVLFGLDQPDALIRGGKELKHAASLSDCVHSELTKSFVKRARSQVKEILDTPALLGPSRQLGVQDVLQDFVMSTVPTVIDRFGAFAVHASDRELVIVAPVDKAYPLARALRDSQREAFLELPTASGKRLAKHVGPQAPSSAIVAIAWPGEMVGPLVRDCRNLLAELARESLGGDALVVIRRAPHTEDRVYAAHWDELTTSLDVLLSRIPDADARRRLVRALGEVVPALSNPDLDKPSPLARPALVACALSEIGLVSAEEDATAMARAVCQLVDHCVRLPHTAEESHVLDGLWVASNLSGVDQ